jgi:hypothetical protein
MSLPGFLLIGVRVTNLCRGHTHTYTYSQDGGVKILIIPFLVSKLDK